MAKKIVYAVLANTTVTGLYLDREAKEASLTKPVTYTHMRDASAGMVLLHGTDCTKPWILVEVGAVIEMPVDVEETAATPAPSEQPKAPVKSGAPAKTWVDKLPHNPDPKCTKCGGTGFYKDGYTKDRPCLAPCCYGRLFTPWTRITDVTGHLTATTAHAEEEAPAESATPIGADALGTELGF